MGAAPVGLHPEFHAPHGVEYGHDHAAVRQTASVLIHIFGLTVPIVTTLVATEHFGHGPWCQDGLRTGRDPDFPEREKRGTAQDWDGVSNPRGAARW